MHADLVPWKRLLAVIAGLALASAIENPFRCHREGVLRGQRAVHASPTYVHVKLEPGVQWTAAGVRPLFTHLQAGVDDDRARWIRVPAGSPAAAAELAAKLADD